MTATVLAPAGKRCRICGMDKPLSLFGADHTEPDGFNSACKRCLRLRERQRRASRSITGSVAAVPPVLGLATGEGITTAVLGALRERFDGNASRFARSMLDVMREADVPTRLAAGISLLALREWAAALVRVAPLGELELLHDSLSDADWSALVARQDRRRTKKAD